MNQNRTYLYSVSVTQITESFLHSYSQVFFSNQKIFAVILIIVSFFDFYAGLSGFLAVLFSNLAALLIGFNKKNIQAGYYGFNSLLVGLGMGIYYNFNAEYLLVLLFTSIFTLFVTVVLEGVIGKYGLPYLSVPFLFGLWVITLASRQFSALSISERGVFMTNELYQLGGTFFLGIYDWLQNLNLHESIIIYFRSLGAIFFQYHLFAGILIAFGLLIYSRIAFVLSLLGYFSAYLFYQTVGGNMLELNYGYIGFNFILTAIAAGGYFIQPSKYSFLWVVLLTPLISLIITSSMAVFQVYQLSIYSLPFNVIILMFLYILKFRVRALKYPEIVYNQHFSPEKNLYTHLNYNERFMDQSMVPLLLPFWGKWTVTQAHFGEFTHKDDWAHAWDFEIENEDGTKVKNRGNLLSDYYCYDKPVIAPAEGVIEEVVNSIEDNDIGDMNLENNWGNTVIIKHGNELYTKLSHLKKNSIKVIQGDVVKRGDLIGKVGNSGRSPVPHLHFQIQATPFIGSKTIDYPIAHYVLHKQDSYEFKTYSRPGKNDEVSNIKRNTNLEKAFHFIPGQQIKFKLNADTNKTGMVKWEVKADVYNNTYLHCQETKSIAWFKNESGIHYFTGFYGDKNSLLFYFYLGAYKVINGFYKGISITDNYPLHILNKKPIMFIQDLLAPFYIFIKPVYSLEFISQKDNLSDSNIVFFTKSSIKYWNRIHREINFEFEIESKRIKRFVVLDGNKILEASEVKTV